MIGERIKILSTIRLAVVFTASLCLFACGKLSPDFETDATKEKPADTHVDFVTTGSYSKVLFERGPSRFQPSSQKERFI